MVRVPANGLACDLDAFRLLRNPHIAKCAMCGASGRFTAHGDFMPSSSFDGNSVTDGMFPNTSFDWVGFPEFARVN